MVELVATIRETGATHRTRQLIKLSVSILILLNMFKKIVNKEARKKIKHFDPVVNSTKNSPLYNVNKLWNP